MKVSSKQEIIKRIQQNNAVIKAMGISSIGLFGSFVKNEASENSDVDLLIEFEQGQKNYTNYIRVAYFLEELMGRKTEVLTKKGLSKYIGPQILETVEYVPLSA
jgi:uncharacterized protein